MNIFDSLITRRDDMTLGPALAERWEIDDSKKIWTFYLRKGVNFSNGEPFDAKSVKFTFERMLNKKIRPRTTVPRRIALDRIEIDGAIIDVGTPCDPLRPPPAGGPCEPIPEGVGALVEALEVFQGEIVDGYCMP